ncbi:MAG TPA: hypothetical protein VGK33_01010 [Chloroflexota bacterium]
MIAAIVALVAFNGAAAAQRGTAAAEASAARSDAKAIWGPVSIGGKSEFPVYHGLGVGIFEMALKWAAAAPTPPSNASDPADPAYRWPANISYAIQQASRYHMRVMLQVSATPAWANGGAGWTYPPADVGALGQFLTAASRRFPSIHLWMIWGEPDGQANFALTTNVSWRARRLTPSQARAPHIYAEMLDASYGALKRVSASNLVIGGDTYAWGNIPTRLWVENLRLANGRPPRMDLYGHNPFCWRNPNLANPPSPDGFYDFSDLSRLSRLVNSNLATKGHQIKLFLSEWTIPTSPLDHEFNFYVTPSVQAQWIRDAWRIVRGSPWFYALGWIHLQDDPPGQGTTGGLLDYRGHPKPGYYAFKDG